jgi:hypothetical protein
MFFNFGGDDPFGGGGGRMPQRRQADVDTTALYKILGIDKNASESEIKKAYRKEAMLNHPDKNPGSAVVTPLFTFPCLIPSSNPLNLLIPHTSPISTRRNSRRFKKRMKSLSQPQNLSNCLIPFCQL